MEHAIFLFGTLATTPLEIVSFALALVMVLLNIRQSPWAWLFAIASAALYAAVFRDARLYGDMALQFVFVAVSLWGWYQWLFGGREHRGIAVTRLGRRGWLLLVPAWALGHAAVFFILHGYTDSDVPHADAFLTAGSLVAQALLTRKVLENWLLWIGIDLLYVGLYIHKDLYLTAALYGLFALLAAAGLRAWQRTPTAQHA